MFNTLFEYLEEQKFPSVYQSCFCSNGACVSELLSISCKVYNNFDDNSSLETYGLFLENFWAFWKILTRKANIIRSVVTSAQLHTFFFL